jgi:multidrug efflux pump subunit AcrA (membrane-fusion protein)
MLRKRAFWIGLIVLVLAAGGGYAYYRNVYQPSQESVEPTIATTQVRSGDLIVSVSGSGTLSPASEIGLGFQSGGYLDEVLVEVGDQVQEYDTLARLETDDLELAVAEADIKVRLAQLDLDDVLEEPSEAELADAEADVQSTQAALHLRYRAKFRSRCLRACLPDPFSRGRRSILGA